MNNTHVLDVIVTELVNPTTVKLALVTDQGVKAAYTLSYPTYSMIETAANSLESLSSKSLAVQTNEGKQRVVKTRTQLLRQVDIACDQLLSKNLH